MMYKQKLWTITILLILLALTVAACSSAQSSPDTAAVDQAQAAEAAQVSDEELAPTQAESESAKADQNLGRH